MGEVEVRALLSIALATDDEAGREHHHAALLDLARKDELDVASYEAAGESLELDGHARAALRWYNLALGDLRAGGPHTAASSGTNPLVIVTMSRASLQSPRGPSL